MVNVNILARIQITHAFFDHLLNSCSFKVPPLLQKALQILRPLLHLVTGILYLVHELATALNDSYRNLLVLKHVCREKSYLATLYKFCEARETKFVPLWPFWSIESNSFIASSHCSRISEGVCAAMSLFIQSQPVCLLFGNIRLNILSIMLPIVDKANRLERRIRYIHKHQQCGTVLGNLTRTSPRRTHYLLHSPQTTGVLHSVFHQFNNLASSLISALIPICWLTTTSPVSPCLRSLSMSLS